MKILEFVVEQRGNKELLVNGVHWANPSAKGHMIGEIVADLPLDQQWAILTSMAQMIQRMRQGYEKARVKQNEITMDQFSEEQKRKHMRKYGITRSGKDEPGLPPLTKGGI